MTDMAQKGRSAQHQGVDNGRAKINEGQVCEVRRLLKEKISQTQIADRVGIDQTTVSKIKLGRLWAHVTCPEDE